MYTCVQSLLSETLRPGLMDALEADNPHQSLLAWEKRQKQKQQQKKKKKKNKKKQQQRGPSRASAKPSSSADSPMPPSDASDGSSMDDGENDNDDSDDDASNGEGSSFGPVYAATATPSALAHCKTLPNGVKVVDPKSAWSDADVEKMIELRAQGLTHRETAVSRTPSPPPFYFSIPRLSLSPSFPPLLPRTKKTFCLSPDSLTPPPQALLGRGQGAVENKYGRVVKEPQWKPLVAQLEAQYVAQRGQHRDVRRARISQTRFERMSTRLANAAAARIGIGTGYCGDDDSHDEEEEEEHTPHHRHHHDDADADDDDVELEDEGEDEDEEPAAKRPRVMSPDEADEDAADLE